MEDEETRVMGGRAVDRRAASNADPHLPLVRFPNYGERWLAWVIRDGVIVGSVRMSAASATRLAGQGMRRCQ